MYKIKIKDYNEYNRELHLRLAKTARQLGMYIGADGCLYEIKDGRPCKI